MTIKMFPTCNELEVQVSRRKETYQNKRNSKPASGMRLTNDTTAAASRIFTNSSSNCSSKSANNDLPVGGRKEKW